MSKTIPFEVLEQQLLQNESFKNEYLNTQAEYEAMREVMKARIECDLTQKELSQLSGVTQADISRIENGNFNPTIKMLQRLAAGMNRHIELKFVPNT